MPSCRRPPGTAKGPPGNQRGQKHSIAPMFGSWGGSLPPCPPPPPRWRRPCRHHLFRTNLPPQGCLCFIKCRLCCSHPRLLFYVASRLGPLSMSTVPLNLCLFSLTVVGPVPSAGAAAAAHVWRRRPASLFKDAPVVSRVPPGGGRACPLPGPISANIASADRCV